MTAATAGPATLTDHRPDIADRFLSDRRRSAVGWSIGILVYCVLMMVLWPVIRDSEGYQSAAQDLPEAFDAFFGPGGIDLATAGGYLDTYLFGMMVPLMMIIAGVAAGASIIGGEEEDGTLELLLSHPVTRRRVVLEKSSAVAGYLFPFALIVVLTVVALAPAVDMEIPAGNVVAAALGSWLVGVVYAVAALAIGTLSGRRGTAASIAGGLAGAAYLLQVVAQLAGGWEWVRWLSPLYLANGTSPIENGIPTGEYLALAGIVAAVLLAAVVAFDRRDLRA